MKVFFTVITAIVALAVVYWKRNVTYNDQPCEPNPDNNAYNKFAHKHILQGPVPTNIQQWQKYLIKMKLCYAGLHTFFKKTDEEAVKLICNGHSKRYSGNLCISNAKMEVHEVTVTQSHCPIAVPVPMQRHVTVACDIIDNQCLPVHFQGSGNSGPTIGAVTCQPGV